MPSPQVPPAVAAELASIKERLEALENPGTSADGKPATTSGPADGPLWAVDELSRHLGPSFESEAGSGSVVYAGRVDAPGTGELRWQIERPVPGLLAQPWDDAAPSLAALGHPLRLTILQRLLTGGRTLADLVALPDAGTTGQVQHHLRELRAAGLVRQRSRNDYEVVPQRVIPCLAMVAAALGT